MFWLALLLLVWSLCRIVGGGLNHLAGRPLLNWWAGFAGCYFFVFLINVCAALLSEPDELFASLGELTLCYLLPCLIGGACAKRWRGRNPNTAIKPTTLWSQ